jgi:hypothetical protein
MGAPQQIIANSYRLQDPGFEPQWSCEIVSPRQSILVLELTQPPLKWVLRALSRG